jgi:hypothetical protein
MTASPMPTATPDLAATQSVQETATMAAVQSKIEEALAKLNIPSAGGRVAHSQEEPIVASSEGYNENDYQPLLMNEDVMDSVIHTDVTWTAEAGFSECGIVFSKVGNNFKNYYEFDMLKLSGLPYWFSAKVADGVYRGGQRAPVNAIKVEDGSTNAVIIMVKDKTITYFVNGTKIQTSSDAGLTKKGGFGFVSWQESGSAKCEFTDIWVWTWDK